MKIENLHMHAHVGFRGRSPDGLSTGIRVQQPASPTTPPAAHYMTYRDGLVVRLFCFH